MGVYENHTFLLLLNYRNNGGRINLKLVMMEVGRKSLD